MSAIVQNYYNISINMPKVVKTLLYDEFLKEAELPNFEADLENRKYHDWVDKYPDHTLSIFGAVMYFGGYDVDDEDVEYFKSKGVDLNAPSNIYPADSDGTTALGSACEYRNMKLIKALVKHGAKINQEDQHGFTPLESMLTGHSVDDSHNFKACEEGIKLLVELGVDRAVQKYIIDNFCQNYLKKSDYLKKFLNEAKKRIPIKYQVV